MVKKTESELMHHGIKIVLNFPMVPSSHIEVKLVYLPKKVVH